MNVDETSLGEEQNDAEECEKVLAEQPRQLG